MSTADYILAVLGLLITIVAGGFSVLVTMAPMFNPQHSSLSGKGLLGVAACGAMAIYLIVALIHGDWSWM